MADTTARETFLVNQLHALAISIGQAKARNDVADVQNLQAAFKQLAAEYAAIGSGDVTAFDRAILSTDAWIRSALDAIPGAVAAIPSAIGMGLLKAAAPFVALALLLGFARKKL
jgi:hypothetical protein